jgi:1-aminocyclopropane-1-carboxylate deaminase/D-cysteine desulfhydrase-like pyridoxal-dependent ACC family enzyme
MQRLGDVLGGLEIWFKRDDLISFGFGGNKVRGLEMLLGDALSRGADTLVTGAGCQSNHVRATAAAAAHRGLRCVAVFWGEPPAVCEGNYRLTRLLGAEICFTGDPDRSSVDVGIEEHCARLRARGRRPYAIPRGGACSLGAIGHTLAAHELFEQCGALGIEPEVILLPAGSGATHAGWLLGTWLHGMPWAVESVAVSRDADATCANVDRLAAEAAGLAGVQGSFGIASPTVLGGFIGAGYGVPTAEGAHAIQLVAQTEGVLLDPTYTGKAMAGLLAQRNAGRLPYRSIIFLHTGGEPALFTGDGVWLANLKTDVEEPPCISSS